MPHLEIVGVRLDYRVIDGDEALPWLIFLHEGLGSVELWRDFPERVGAATRCRALIYSRHGHGWSDPLTGPRSPEFMHEEARAVLPAIREKLGVGPYILVGHSDGASIALIAAAGADPLGVVALAPHVFVEAESLAGAEAARQAFVAGGLDEKMARYHHDPSATFYGWYDIWRSPRFRDWNIEGLLGGIRCPLLVVQGSDDEYGTSAQLDAITRGVAGPVQQVLMEGCGHSPHLDRPEQVIDATVGFVDGLLKSPAPHD